MKKLAVIMLIPFLLNSCFSKIKESMEELEKLEIKYTKPVEEIQAEIQKDNDFEEVQITKSISTFVSDTTKSLVLTLVNGNMSQDNETLLDIVGKESIQILVKNVSNYKDFDEFRVVFYWVEKEGIMTKEFSHPYTYTEEDLRLRN
jgi:hypothetical protein